MSKIQKLIESGKISNQTTANAANTDATNNGENIQLVKSKTFDFVPPKPLLKWVGGKTQILEKISGEFPTNIKNYHEIFIGGGSVLLALLHLIKSKTIQVTGTINAYDLNSELINMYKVVQSKPKKLFSKITKIIVNESDGKRPEQYIVKDLAPNFQNLVATMITPI